MNILHKFNILNSIVIKNNSVCHGELCPSGTTTRFCGEILKETDEQIVF